MECCAAVHDIIYGYARKNIILDELVIAKEHRNQHINI